MATSLGRIVCVAALMLGAHSVALAQAGDPMVRLRSRTFVPPSNIATETPRAAGAHVLIQFAAPIDDGVLVRLRDAGAVPLRYVPDHTVLALVGPGFTAASVEGVRWTGELLPSDRVSAETAEDLARAFPSYPLTVVEFHPDITRAAAAALLADAGAAVVRVDTWPSFTAIVATAIPVIERLAEQDAVAWIYPAPATAGEPSGLCGGLVRPEGLVASFAAAGDGWDGPGRGTARLGYILTAPSRDLPASLQIAELTRAMDEWSRYAAVTWTPSGASAEPGSVHILWGPRDHGDGFPFGAAVLAHAFYPAPLVPEPVAGDIHFNDTFTWGAGDPRRWDVFTVALHELGHSLGLVHSADPASVMYPMYRGIVDGLAGSDAHAVRQLYAAPPAPSLPPGWVDEAIGGDGDGAAVEEVGRVRVTAGGRDIWDSADDFRFVWRTLAGDGDLVARVDSLHGTHRWTKAGIMIRASSAPGAAHATALASLGRGTAFQRRRAGNAWSLHTPGPPTSAPVWLWLSRRGPHVEAYAASDTGEWQLIGFDTIALGHEVMAGLAVTNHDVTGLATAVFSNASLVPLSAGWWSADIGAVGLAGAASTAGGTFRVRAAGDDIWGQADAFHFVWQELKGDVEITARLSAVSYTRSWAKAGVMIRAGLDPGAAHAFMLGSARKGFAFQRRPESGGPSVHTPGPAGPAPGWLRLTRRGPVVTASYSVDGRSWQLVGSDAIALEETVYVGLAVSSHTAAAICEAIFDEVSVVRSP